MVSVLKIDLTVIFLLSGKKKWKPKLDGENDWSQALINSCRAATRRDGVCRLDHPKSRPSSHGKSFFSRTCSIIIYNSHSLFQTLLGGFLI